jgi:hypothetical protein
MRWTAVEINFTLVSKDVDVGPYTLAVGGEDST